MWKRPLLALLVLLTACTAAPQTATGISPEILMKLSETPTPAATPTAPTETPSPSTQTPRPTPDPQLFRDNFASVLDPQWTWVREDPDHWSLRDEPGFLHINAGSGSVAGRSLINLLLRPAPEGNFQIETQVDFNPRHNSEIAGLIIYESDSTFIQAGRAYCNHPECVGEGLYMYYYDGRVPVKPHFAQSYRDQGPVMLRLTREGNTYTFEGSTNGKVWFLIGAHTSDMQPTQVGLLAGQHSRGIILTASFDYFQMRGLP